MKDPQANAEQMRALITGGTSDDLLDAWIEAHAGQVPGGEYVVRPVETTSIPQVSDSMDREQAFLDNFYEALEGNGLGRRPPEPGDDSSAYGLGPI